VKVSRSDKWSEPALACPPEAEEARPLFPLEEVLLPPGPRLLLEDESGWACAGWTGWAGCAACAAWAGCAACWPVVPDVAVELTPVRPLLLLDRAP